MTTFDTERRRSLLQRFQLRDLFNDLGWDRLRIQPITIDHAGHTYKFHPVAEKRGVQVFEGGWDADGKIPPYGVRRKLEQLLAKHAYEHLLIFTDEAKTTQIWQWVKREPGRPPAYRESTYRAGQSGERLLQEISHITFTLSDEETLSITGVTQRLQQAFDKDRVTKKFYDRFQQEHKDFVGFIQGIEDRADCAWYASLMLNRLMFVYFIQKQGFLDGDRDYLRNRLERLQRERGTGTFHTFYRHFLRRLFHEGLGQPPSARSSELDALLGNVPFLNGGLFDVHELEREYTGIDVPDDAFVRLFDFFDAYTWHLDDRPLRNDREINPDVLGYIFEKYVNQKQMGAYYTKEDITEYIAKNTIIPFIFDAAKKEVPIAFRPDGYVWKLLQENPDRYIYPTVRKGVDVPWPEEVEPGLDDVSKREGWNRPADPALALPTETWREYVARRRRYEQIWHRLVDGKVTSIDDLITLNLDIRQFAEDVIDTCEGPELLRALYRAITSITVLDPTCGSGAFLFAALTILEPLYDACLDRMQGFLDDLARSGELHHPKRFEDFRQILDRVAQHPSRLYYILKEIILNNLYGVDIMAEAVEICKLRLFLKLVAQLERPEQIEPLPDIDFNIRAGNTLVGFATYDEIKRAVLGGQQTKMQLFDDMKRIDERADIADRAFRKFHEMQSEHGMDAADFRDAKQDLRDRLIALGAELDRYLATEYGIQPDTPEFIRWREIHRPFHWIVEFYGIIRRGGFNVIVGNPPYVGFAANAISNEAGIGIPFKSLFRHYESRASGNLYALVVERSLSLLASDGLWSFVVPLSLTFSQDFSVLRQLIQRRSAAIWYSSYDNIPDRAFTGEKESQNTSKANQQRVTIVVARQGSGTKRAYATPILRWRASEREHMFQNLPYEEASDFISSIGWPKLGRGTAGASLLKAVAEWPRLGTLRVSKSRHRIVVPKTAGYYVSAYVDPMERSKQLSLYWRDSSSRDLAIVVINSNFFFWWYRAWGDGFDVTASLIESCPIPPTPRDGYRELADLLIELQAECTVYKAYRGAMVPNINFNGRMDVLKSCDDWIISHLPEDFRPTWIDLLRYKSSSWYSFEIAKSVNWPEGFEYLSTNADHLTMDSDDH